MNKKAVALFALTAALSVSAQLSIKEEGKFNLNDVANALCDKLIRRHPHVFGDVQVDGTGQVLRNWEQIKQTEKKKNPDRSALDGVPTALPALIKAQRTPSQSIAGGIRLEGLVRSARQG